MLPLFFAWYFLWFCPFYPMCPSAGNNSCFSFIIYGFFYNFPNAINQQTSIALEQQKLKILMLGWEFPPILTGGLGQACFGMASALAEVADVTVIIPRKPVQVPDVPVQLIGLNQLNYDHEREKIIEKKYETRFKIHYFDALYDLYPGGTYSERKELVQEETLEIEDISFGSPVTPQLLEQGLLYGPDVMDKVAIYTREVLRLGADLDFDLIHAHDWMTFPAAIALKEQTHKPLVVHIHSLETDRNPGGTQPKIREIETAGMKAANFIFAVSNYTMGCILEHYGNIDIRKVHVVHNGIDENIPAPSTPKTKGHVKKVLFLGRVTRQKGPTFLVETALLLTKKMHNVRFVVAGIGDRLRETMQYARTRHVFEYFEFVGFLDRQQVANMLADADAYFMPSVSEPFGLAALEAAVAEVPVVISRQSGVTETVPFMLQADYWDVEKFANYLYALLNYPGLSREIAHLSKGIVPAITWQKSAEDMVFLYEKLVGKN
jgi:glycosyltransferase involved in cell wall biosynthesis